MLLSATKSTLACQNLIGRLFGQRKQAKSKKVQGQVRCQGQLALPQRPAIPLADCRADASSTVSLAHNDQPTRCDSTKISDICRGSLPKPSVMFSSTFEVWQPPTLPRVSVLCDHWPVWIFGLLALPCTISKIYLPICPPSSCRYLREVFPCLTFTSAAFDYNVEDLVFLHGTETWLEHILSLLPPDLPVVHSFTFAPALTSPSIGYILQSIQAGSVVDGNWGFWSRALGAEHPSPTNYPGFIKHIGCG